MEEKALREIEEKTRREARERAQREAEVEERYNIDKAIVISIQDEEERISRDVANTQQDPMSECEKTVSYVASLYLLD